MNKLTQKELKEQLTYNPDTGIFRWKVTRHRIKKGQKIKSQHDKGYITLKLFVII